MFESKSKKHLKQKYNRFKGVSPNALPANSVYGELKLSEQLSHQLNLVQIQVDFLKESLEEMSYKSESTAK